MDKEQFNEIIAGQVKIISLLRMIIIMLLFFGGLALGVMAEMSPMLIYVCSIVVFLLFLAQLMAKASAKIGQKSYDDLEKKILSDSNEASGQDIAN